eukprot:6546950-Ditylum_brightwellii.AAC.1
MKIQTSCPLTGDFLPSALISKANSMLSAVKKLQKCIDEERKDKRLSVRPHKVNIDKACTAMERCNCPKISSQQENDKSGNAFIDQRLVEIEDKHNIRIIFASECSSCIIGTSHQNSDHDIAAIFVYPTNRNQPDVEVMFWESQTAFQLLTNNNQTLLEAFQLPLVYHVFGMDK